MARMTPRLVILQEPRVKAAVDMLAHRLVPIKHMDLSNSVSYFAARRSCPQALPNHIIASGGNVISAE